jgi:hypothetical protein
MNAKLQNPNLNIKLIYKVFMIAKGEFIIPSEENGYVLVYADERFHLYFRQPDGMMPVEIPREMYYVIAGIERFNKVYFAGDLIKAHIKEYQQRRGTEDQIVEYCAKDVLGIVEIRKLGGLGFCVIKANPNPPDEFDAMIDKFIRIKETDEIIGHVLTGKHLIEEFGKEG